MVEYDFTVLCSCGHTEILSGPDRAYELQSLEHMLTVPCCACASARSLLEALEAGDKEAAQGHAMEWAQFMVSAGDERTAALVWFLGGHRRD